MDQKIKEKDKKVKLSIRVGAAFIMAASATGPGFMTQASKFTQDFGANLILAILVSILFNIGIQLNVGRVIGVSGMRGQDVANKVVHGWGYLLTFFIIFGGLIFNIGNIGGAALGLQVLTGMSIKLSSIICGIIGILIFTSRSGINLIDKMTKYLGIIMIMIVIYTVSTNNPPIQETINCIMYPENIKPLIFPMLTLLGGSVGGYITFVGGHRLIDSGVTGRENIKEIDKSILSGIGIVSMIRILFFLAVLGVVDMGIKLDPLNPAASAFRYGTGELGYKFFGILLCCAGIAATIAATYTSASFLQSLKFMNKKMKTYFSVAFIIISTLIMILVGQPANLLVVAGTINGLLLPMILLTILVAAKYNKIIGDYKHPLWLYIFGIVSLVTLTYSSFQSLKDVLSLIQ